MKDHFRIITQLHAEGEAAPAAPAPAATEPAPAAPVSSEPAPAATPAPTPAEPAATPAATPTPAQASAAPDYKVIVDTGSTQLIEEPNGRRRIIEVEKPAAANPEPAPEAPVPGTGENAHGTNAEPQRQADSAPVPEPTANPEPTPAPAPQLQPYTFDELTLAIQLGAVDESRIPPSLAVQYGQFKERQAQQAAIAAGQQEAAKPTKEEEAQQRIQFMEQVEKTAYEITLKQLGLTEQDVTDSEYSDYSDDPEKGNRVKQFNSLKEYNKQRIFADVLQEQQKAAAAAEAQKAINNSVAAFEQQERQKEPKFNEINKELLTYYQSLPYSKGARYAEAINSYNKGTLTEQQAKDLQEYYDETKKMVYARANNLSTTPKPVVRRPASVESPGTGLNIPKQADPSELGKLDYLGKLAWFGKNT